MRLKHTKSLIKSLTPTARIINAGGRGFDGFILWSSSSQLYRELLSGFTPESPMGFFNKSTERPRPLPLLTQEVWGEARTTEVEEVDKHPQVV